MKVIAYFSPNGEIFAVSEKEQDKPLNKIAKKIYKKYYLDREVPQYPHDILLREGWACLMYNNMFDKGLHLAYEGISQNAFLAIDKYLRQNWPEDTWGHTLATNWAYERAYY